MTSGKRRKDRTMWSNSSHSTVEGQAAPKLINAGMPPNRHLWPQLRRMSGPFWWAENGAWKLNKNASSEIYALKDRKRCCWEKPPSRIKAGSAVHVAFLQRSRGVRSPLGDDNSALETWKGKGRMPLAKQNDLWLGLLFNRKVGIKRPPVWHPAKVEWKRWGIHEKP